ncbi:MAG TPA: hypothetical protein VHM02_08650 [Thermoanaerobaculia bacterium]|nr:hypothetical protein [Thermoanaerobaculia bacterium]
MIDYEDFREEIRRLRHERWARILEGEPPGRPAGRRPRDPEQEEVLLAMDRQRLEKRCQAEEEDEGR